MINLENMIDFETDHDQLGEGIDSEVSVLQMRRQDSLANVPHMNPKQSTSMIAGSDIVPLEQEEDRSCLINSHSLLEVQPQIRRHAESGNLFPFCAWRRR